VKLVVCVTGASGAAYARRTLTLLDAIKTGRDPSLPHRDDLSVDWVASTAAAQVWREELGEDMPGEIGPGLRRFARDDFRAPFASGSNAPDAVIVIPCSMSTLARVAHGGGDDLIARACEVALKERRKLILVARETPLSLVHLRAMIAATEAGATVLPAVPSFYAGIERLEQAIDTVVARALDHAGLELNLLRRWGAST
jgi:polyprenyl P-hydroxybenzoate/phenylacrylic acid decarboxylase-like protein